MLGNSVIYRFSKKEYIKQKYFIYICKWLIPPSLISIFMYLTNTLSFIFFWILLLVFALLTIILFFNKVRILKKSNIYVFDDSIKYKYFKIDKYISNSEFKYKQKKITYYINNIEKLDFTANGVKIYGKIILEKTNIENNKSKTKETHINSVFIPKQFYNWSNFTSNLLKLYNKHTK